MAAQRAHRAQRGFSLIELIVAAAIMVIVVGAASTALIGQYRAMQSVDLSRDANTTNRTAMMALETSLRELGWGINPPDAIDLTLDCRGGATCRDSNTAPDELSFVSRNPLYRWVAEGEPGCTTAGGCFTGNAWPMVVDASAKTIDVTLPNNVELKKGQIVLLACTEGTHPMMLRLASRVVGDGTLKQLAWEAATNAPYNDPTQLNTCHSAANSAAMFLVNRYHYFITTISGASWLVLDTGLDLDQDGNLPPGDADDLIPVAKNVEDMQVAYVFHSDSSHTPVGGDWVLGNDTSTAEEPSRTATAPLYTDGANADSRFSANPANVRAIRVSLRTRSDRRDPTHSTSWSNIPTSAFTVENRSVTVTPDGYRRYTAQTTLYVRNLESRLAFYF